MPTLRQLAGKRRGMWEPSETHSSTVADPARTHTAVPTVKTGEVMGFLPLAATQRHTRVSRRVTPSGNRRHPAGRGSQVTTPDVARSPLRSRRRALSHTPGYVGTHCDENKTSRDFDRLALTVHVLLNHHHTSLQSLPADVCRDTARGRPDRRRQRPHPRRGPEPTVT